MQKAAVIHAFTAKGKNKQTKKTQSTQKNTQHTQPQDLEVELYLIFTKIFSASKFARIKKVGIHIVSIVHTLNIISETSLRCCWLPSCQKVAYFKINQIFRGHEILKG